MDRLRGIRTALVLMIATPFMSGCFEALFVPCYNKYDDHGSWRFTTPGLMDGNWDLATIDGNAFGSGYVVPFTGGTIVANGGYANFNTTYVYWDDKCEKPRTTKGVITATYQYRQSGELKYGQYSATFVRDHDTNSLILGAAGQTRSAVVTEENGRPVRFTGNAVIKKWGLETSFVLVFQKNASYPRVGPF